MIYSSAEISLLSVKKPFLFEKEKGELLT